MKFTFYVPHTQQSTVLVNDTDGSNFCAPFSFFSPSFCILLSQPRKGRNEISLCRSFNVLGEVVEDMAHIELDTKLKVIKF